jgi:alpha-1,2-mannosyltransferase
MDAVLKRLGEYRRLAWHMGTYALLVALWVTLIDVFYDHMAPRLSYLTTHKAIANDLPCGKPECDFSVFWPAGRLVREHAFTALYTPQIFDRAASAMLLPGSRLETFFYPPHMLLPAALISYLPFEWGFFVWTFGMVLIAALVLRMGRLPWLVILAGLLSPAALWTVELGQIGVLGGALLVTGLLLSLERPRVSGGLMGFLVCKPQIGILVPVVLLAQRNWRGLGFFVLIAGLLTALVTFIFGWSVWTAYFTLGRAEAARVLDAPFNPASYQGWGVSVFWMFRSLHAGLATSFIAQAVSSLLAIMAVFWLWRCPDVSRPELVEMTVFLSLLATPYGYSTDVVGYSIVLAASAHRRGWRIGMLDTLFWLWPAFSLLISERTGVLFTPLVLCLALGRSFLRAGLPMPHLPMRAAVLPRA